MADVAETIEESGRRIGHHAWIEVRLFETLGRWSGTEADPRARALFARQSLHHAWHAEMWHDVLPALPHVPTATLVVPDAADAEVIARLEVLDEPQSGHPGDTDPGGDGAASAGGPGPDDLTAARLAAVYDDALPHLVASYTGHMALTTAITDGPAIRVLRLVMADLTDDHTAGRALLTASTRR
jgi:hypothetical protein